jgi:hypothetical protein
MLSRARNSEAALRFAERRRREDAAPRLREVVPALATLRLEIDERCGADGTGDPKHVRHVVVESAPAMFNVPCGDHTCRDGGHDMTDAVLRALQMGDARFEIEDTCPGTLATGRCGGVMNLVVRATYR